MNHHQGRTDSTFAINLQIETIPSNHGSTFFGKTTMDLRRALPYFCALCLLLLAAIPSAAQVDLYNNGPTDGDTVAFLFNFGLTTSDTFTLASSSTVNGLTFAAWLIPGDVL